MSFTEELNVHENMLIERLRNHQVLSNLQNFSDKKFEDFLLQRRFFSLLFTPALESVLVGLESQEAKSIFGWLIREEYPPNSPSHREDIVSDLLKVGIPKGRILKAKPTDQTQEALNKTLKLVEYGENFDVIGTVAARFIFEVCPGEEYEFIVKELERRYGLKKTDSVFYWPHFEHDKKGSFVCKSHSDKFDFVLEELIDSEEMLELAKQSLEKALKLKLDFYDQFNHKPIV